MGNCEWGMGNEELIIGVRAGLTSRAPHTPLVPSPFRKHARLSFRIPHSPLILHRPTLGILAIVLLSLAAALAIFGPADGNYVQYTSACLRVGVVLAVLWLALPETRPLKNRLLIAGIVLAAVVFVVRPRLLLVVVKNPVAVGIIGAAFFLLKILRPRRSRSEPRTSRKASPPREPKSD
jgi:hypothetical protein